LIEQQPNKDGRQRVRRPKEGDLCDAILWKPPRRSTSKRAYALICWPPVALARSMKSLQQSTFIMTGIHFSAIALTILILAAFAIADLTLERAGVP
jgi:hypothetical protein